MSKPTAKAAAASKSTAASKTPSKAPAKTTEKRSPEAPAKAPAKAAAPAPAKAPPVKAAAKPAPAATEKAPMKPADKAPAKAAAPAAPVSPKEPAAKAPAKAGGKSSGKAEPKLGAKDIPPADSPVPGARHGFAERFGPGARTQNFQMPDTAEMPKAVPKDPKLANAWKNKPGRELSEAELLAMPESEYMNDKQLDFFRARLEQQKAELLSSAGETTEHLREDTSIVPDPVDRATIEEEHALELRTRDRERKLLKKIAQALGRLDTGDYGYCDETGEPIGLQRLMARPTATLSLEAQQRREMKQKMFGD